MDIYASLTEVISNKLHRLRNFFFFFNVKVTFSTENISIINILFKQKFSNFFMPQLDEPLQVMDPLRAMAVS